MTKFNQLQTKDDFAKLLGLKSAKYINYLLYNIKTDNLYTTFTIPKKNGGERVIHAPKKELKFLQKLPLSAPLRGFSACFLYNESRYRKVFLIFLQNS